MRRLSRLSLVVVVLLASAVLAAQAKTPYLTDEKATELAKLLPFPPRENCSETRAELDTILRCQKSCTPQEIARIGIQAYLAPPNFHDVLGTWFNEDNLPQTMRLLQKVNQEGKHCCDIAKQQFGRRRPRFLDPQIKPVFEGTDEPCYPSGHAVQATAMAVILGEIAPDHRNVVMERACEIGWNRIPAGLHYPSDCVAGRTLGKAVAETLLKDPAFKEELEKAKKEYAEVRKEHSEPLTINER